MAGGGVRLKKRYEEKTEKKDESLIYTLYIL